MVGKNEELRKESLKISLSSTFSEREGKSQKPDQAIRRSL